MTSNKAYNISILCQLRGIPRDSEEARVFESWTILKLLNAIKEIKEQRVLEMCSRMDIEADTVRGWTVSKLMNKLSEPEEEEFDPSITRRVGCVHI